MASAPRSKNPRAIRSVIPTPPAAFSPFTTTKSGSWRSRSCGSSSSSARRPGLPTTSPTKSSFTGKYRSRGVALAADTAVLEANGLVKRFGERVALREVSLRAQRGGLVAVIGPNGAGKTTLLSILAGIQNADAGTVSRNRGEVGWVPQQAAVYNKLTVAENLRLFARLERRSDVEAALDAMLEQTGLRDRADDQIQTLSGGNRQRVNIAIGLLSEPEVLLLDEPSAALDPRQRERLWRFILELAERGTTVIYSTHVVQEAERYAGQVVVLADGERLFTGSPRDMERTVEEESAAPAPDFEAAFVAFLHERGH